MKGIIFVPLQGYRCLECGDAFALEQSLVRHYSRRSLRIEVTCNQCTKRLAFFNKCSLLLHAREHKEKGLIMQCSHLVMKPVPVEQMIGQPDSVAVGWWRFLYSDILIESADEIPERFSLQLHRWALSAVLIRTVIGFRPGSPKSQSDPTEDIFQQKKRDGAEHKL